jgi:hypothetical protein
VLCPHAWRSRGTRGIHAVSFLNSFLQLSARAIREEKNLEAFVAEILEGASK